MGDYLSKNNKIEWKSIKIPFIIYWFFVAKGLLFDFSSISANKGFCYFVDCHFILNANIKFVLLGLMLIFSILYLWEKKMVFTTLMLGLLSFIIYSLHESQGISNRTGLITLIFLVQSLAYGLFGKKGQETKLHYNRIFYPIQIILASYTLSGLSKLIKSGPTWFLEGKYMALQVLKSNQMKVLSDYHAQSAQIFDEKVSFINNFPILIGLMLLMALLIELGSFVGLLNKKTRLLWGFLLFMMHVGIYLFFEIVIGSFVMSLICFVINPFYLIYLGFNKKNKNAFINSSE